MKRYSLYLLIFAGCLSSRLEAQGCPALSEGKKDYVIEYVRKTYKLGDSVDLKVTQEKLVGSSCYRALTFEGKGNMNTWHLSLYLSPEQRFLTGDLLDTTLDPVKEEQRKAEALMVGLVPNKGASKGPDTAPVTIVEFSDFECPYCRRFADVLEQTLPTNKDQVRIVFHHFPLSIHPWARTAAQGAACAQLQNSEGFWAIHDQLFKHQEELTPTNIRNKLMEYAQSSKSLDTKLFQTCVENDMSLGLVFRDMNLASANGVQATPTLFINGHRFTGVRDAKQLLQLIEEAKKDSLALSSKPSVASISNQAAVLRTKQ
jgi:protein-disulfide isomerase